MNIIEVPPLINQIISVFYFMRLWRRDHVSYFSKLVQIVVYMYYPVSLMAAAFTNDDETQQVFSIVASILAYVITARLYYILWKKDEILEFVDKFCSHSILDNDLYNRVNNRISTFMKAILLVELIVTFCIVGLAVTSLPIFTNGKKLPLNVYFPLDWEHNELIYWIAFVLLVYEFVLTLVCMLQTAIVSYLMMCCAIKFETLGIELKNLGYISEEKSSNEKFLYTSEKQTLFYAKLIHLIRNHQDLQK